MIQIKIPVHSFVDVITNSSTTIYCTATGKSEQFAKDMINEILSANKSYLENVEIFDIYRGTPIEKGQKSVAMNVA